MPCLSSMQPMWCIRFARKSSANQSLLLVTLICNVVTPRSLMKFCEQGEQSCVFTLLLISITLGGKFKFCNDLTLLLFIVMSFFTARPLWPVHFSMNKFITLNLR